ncbi:MAG: lysine exporter LysO family protein [Bacillota bacterium]
MDMWLIVLFLLLGFVIGFFRIFSNWIFKLAGYITTIGLVILLASMGAKIGMDPEILKQLDKIGLQAFFMALGSIIGSIILVKVFSMRLKDTLDSSQKDKVAKKEVENNNHFMTYMIVFSVIIGIFLGLFFLPPGLLDIMDSITTFALAALLFGVGVDLGKNKEIFSELKTLGWHILALPFLVAIGSILGAIIIGAFIGFSSNEAAAVGAGFGWYSLSGVILGELHSVELGSLAFLANVFRELITIISLPFIVKYFGKLTSIAPGGATTMDVTLPVIKETAGEEVVIPAFFSGAVLSILVPILVPFLLTL